MGADSHDVKLLVASRTEILAADGGAETLRVSHVPASVLNNLAAGLDAEGIARSYPSVTPESVRAAMRYAAELAKEQVLP